MVDKGQSSLTQRKNDIRIEVAAARTSYCYNRPFFFV